ANQRIASDPLAINSEQKFLLLPASHIRRQWKPRRLGHREWKKHHLLGKLHFGKQRVDSLGRCSISGDHELRRYAGLADVRLSDARSYLSPHDDDDRGAGWALFAGHSKAARASHRSGRPRR